MSIFDLIPETETTATSPAAPRRQGIMLCYPFEEKRLARWSPPYLVQPKLDGERCRDIAPQFFNGDYSPLLVSSEVTPILSLPHLTAELRELHNSLYRSFNPNFSSFRLDGELYVHGLKFEEIHSRVSRTVNPHPDYASVELHVFDLWNCDLPQYDRTTTLLKMQKFFPPHIKLVPTRFAETLDDILFANDQFVSEGYEGIIVRHFNNLYVPRRSTHVMKFKPKKEDTYEIVGVEEAISDSGHPKKMVGSFLCRVRGTSDIFSVSPGRGCTDERKKRWWRERHSFIHHDLLVEYQNLTSKRGVPRFGRFPFQKNLKVLQKD